LAYRLSPPKIRTVKVLKTAKKGTVKKCFLRTSKKLENLGILSNKGRCFMKIVSKQ
jgi:hypothetical protein